jgi:hypothetical protein
MRADIGYNALADILRTFTGLLQNRGSALSSADAIKPFISNHLRRLSAFPAGVRRKDKPRGPTGPAEISA